MTCKEITIDGVKYVRESDSKPAVSTEGLQYCIVRTHSAGVHAGFVKRKEGREVELINARRLWYWKGAATLSQAAMEGFSKPKECKFPCEVDSIILTWEEIIACREKAKASIDEVPVWSV